MSYAEAQSGLWPGKPLSAKEIRELEEKGDKGDREALACLFDYYIYENRNKALLWARKGDKLGDARSRYLLGGLLVVCNDPKDRAEGITVLKKAADQDYFLAQDMLADIYEEGEVVQKDLLMAEKWFGKAAMQGSTTSMLELVRLMTDRATIMRTLSEAYGWTFLMLKRTTSKWSQPFVDKIHEAQREIIKKAKGLRIDEKKVISGAESWAKKQDVNVPMVDPMDRPEPECKYWKK